MGSSNTLISIICVILIVIVAFYFIAVSCASGSYVGTTEVLKQCNCTNCQDKACADCPLCKMKKEMYGHSYVEFGQFESPNYTMPSYPMDFGEQGPPSAIPPTNVTNDYLTLDMQKDLLLREMKAPENINYIHGFIGSRYNNNDLLYKGVW